MVVVVVVVVVVVQVAAVVAAAAAVVEVTSVGPGVQTRAVQASDLQAVLSSRPCGYTRNVSKLYQ